MCYPLSWAAAMSSIFCQLMSELLCTFRIRSIWWYQLHYHAIRVCYLVFSTKSSFDRVVISWPVLATGAEPASFRSLGTDEAIEAEPETDLKCLCCY